MYASSASATAPQNPVIQTVAAWILTLLISILPDIFFQEITGATPGWLFCAKIILLAGVVLAGFFWKALGFLRVYAVIFGVIYLAERASLAVSGSALWRTWFHPETFASQMLGEQVLRVGIALLVVGVSLAFFRKRRAFYCAVGRLNAPARRVTWLGIDEGTPWTRLGPLSAALITLGTLTFLVLAGRPSLADLGKALPLLPAVLIMAVMNAFAEEMTYRAPQLAVLKPSLGGNQALLIAAVYFGIGHFYGVPFGIVGVIMAGLLGWFLGKSMLETKGFLWAWGIHFLQDVAIFSFMAVGSVTAGGV